MGKTEFYISRKEMGISSYADWKAIAASTVRTGGCCGKLTDEEIEKILRECI